MDPSKPKSKEEILKYFAQRLPRSVEEQKILLEGIEEWLDDPEKGPEWVWSSGERLLLEAEFMVDEDPLVDPYTGGKKEVKWV